MSLTRQRWAARHCRKHGCRCEPQHRHTHSNDIGWVGRIVGIACPGLLSSPREVVKWEAHGQMWLATQLRTKPSSQVAVPVEGRSAQHVGSRFSPFVRTLHCIGYAVPWQRTEVVRRHGSSEQACVQRSYAGMARAGVCAKVSFLLGGVLPSPLSLPLPSLSSLSRGRVSLPMLLAAHHHEKSVPVRTFHRQGQHDEGSNSQSGQFPRRYHGVT